MKLKIILLSIGTLFLGASSQLHKGDEIVQVATLSALLDGQYDGKIPYARLKKMGDFGVGTFDQLDGEMVALDGEFFQIKSDGIVYPVKNGIKAPFADLTFFEADQTENINTPLNYAQLRDRLLDLLPDENHYYAIRVSGRFGQVQTRSVHKQQKPYPLLSEAVAQQEVFDYEDIEGTMVGTYMPESASGVGVAGFHFHFISKDKKRGGHLLDCNFEQVKIAIDHTSGLRLLKNARNYN